MHKVFGVFIITYMIYCGQQAYAQNYPVYNSYYLNPYLYNPAEAATEYTYIFLNHRQQWVGIDGQPQVTALTFSTLFDQSKSGVGAKLSNYKRGVISTTDINLTYVYSLHLNEKNTVYFGLSGGVITNSIDLAKVDDPNDPVLAGYLANNIQPASNFGFLFRSASGLNIGVSLPQLFTPAYNGNASFSETGVSPLDNIFVTAYFKRKVEGRIVNRRHRGVSRRVRTDDSYAPLEVYTLYKYAAAGNSQFEAMIKLNLSENFWLGGGYRLSYGFHANIGFALSKFMLSYSYEPGNQPEPAFSTGTHELQLGLKLGEKKEYKRVAPTLRSQMQRATNEQHTARFQQSIEDPDAVQQTAGQAKKQYYVVIKAFADFTSADQFKKKLVDQKFNADVFYYEKEKKFYVHVFNSAKSSEAYEEARNLKAFTKLKEARVLVVTQDK